MLFACTKRTKSTPEVCEPLDSGDDSKLCRKIFSKVFRRHVPKPVLPAKRRRKGFESVRKGYRSADARLMFFRKRVIVLQAYSSKRYSKRVALGGNKKGLCKRKTFGLPKKRMFSAHAMLTNKEKLFLSAPRQLLPTAPKLTRSCKFHPQKPTVSLQYNNPFSKNISLASALR